MSANYDAAGNKVFVTQAEQELFLTVHETDTGGTMTVQQQAEAIATVLNCHDELLAALHAAETRILQLLPDYGRRAELAPYPRGGVDYVGIGPEEDSTVRLIRAALAKAGTPS